MDTWLPIMKKFYEEKASKIKKKHKDFILFCSDFSVTSRDDFEEYSSDIPWGAQRKEVHKIKKKKLKEAELLFQEYKKFINFLKVVDKN